ncbi:MAG TPA: hypothetical protein RMH99_20790 [Sandaracinaceae bacterium LLY-WYZ-13_1]|nr:hypothetical protein [Sandaracinaceae bacterium LLY-WYZ-13_1]
MSRHDPETLETAWRWMPDDDVRDVIRGPDGLLYVSAPSRLWRPSG